MILSVNVVEENERKRREHFNKVIQSLSLDEQRMFKRCFELVDSAAYEKVWFCAFQETFD